MFHIECRFNHSYQKLKHTDINDNGLMKCTASWIIKCFVTCSYETSGRQTVSQISQI